MSDATLYQLTGVCQLYGNTPAVEIPNLTLPSGAVCCLLGPTGAGKSTLLRLLAGVEEPTCGDIMFLGQPMRQLSLTQRRRITMVFQRPLLLAGSVIVNVEYGLRLRGRQCSKEAQGHRIMERLGVTKLASQHAQTLSGGQTQLVALARALAFSPEVLLLDEPTAHLDPAHVALVEQVIHEERQRRGMTVVWATHNLFQARRVADHMSLLLNGRMIESCACAQFFQSPSDPRTKDFAEGKMVY